jgi:NitT/TauT family transport system permease protein
VTGPGPGAGRQTASERRIAAAIAGGIVLAWELLSRVGIVSPTFVPAPTSILRTLGAEIASGVLPGHLAATLGRVVPGLAAGGTAGLLLGLAMGGSRRLRGIVDPFIAALHPVPKLALLPLFMVLLGLGEAPRIAVVALACFFPMLLSAMAGVRQISPIHFEIARNYGASRRQMLMRVVLPGSLPMVLTGVRLAANAALVLAIAVEIASATRGLGSLVWLSWQVFRVELLYATVIVTALLGVGINALLQWSARRLVPWLPDPPAQL